jgi:hypothetical protein
MPENGHEPIWRAEEGDERRRVGGGSREEGQSNSPSGHATPGHNLLTVPPPKAGPDIVMTECCRVSSPAPCEGIDCGASLPKPTEVGVRME